MRTRFRFLHRGEDGFLYWESVGFIGPGESRHEEVTRASCGSRIHACSADWFWRDRVVTV